MSSFMSALAQNKQFVHPGIYQTREDLDYMKSQVNKGEQPWKAAFENLKSKTNLNYTVRSHAYVLRGPGGRPNIGGNDLSNSSSMAYDCALMWYITGEKAYAAKAIDIISAWSGVLRSFDYNDAKLLAGWTGQQLCNAAEILRYTDSGWTKEGQDSFARMMMTVYYPLLRYYFSEANGNWDGAIMQTVMAIGVYLDNREIFQNAVDHFLYAPVNGSVFKYIYPSGQCQESTRDQDHVQLGLCEFAGVARIAFSQGVDLFSIGDNRIALGFEYTAQFLLGNKPHCYGTISEQRMALRGDYESVYQHYAMYGVDVPYTKIVADSLRAKVDRGILTAYRAPLKQPIASQGKPKPSTIAFPAGALNEPKTKAPANAIRVKQGESVQSALDKAGKNGWVVIDAGIHVMKEALKIPSDITISGQGIETILFLDPSGGRDAVVNAKNDMNNVIICDLVIECATSTVVGADPNNTRSFQSRYNRGGIMFLGQNDGLMKSITLRNITVRNGTYNGVFISNASDINIYSCDFTENGSKIIPGPKIQHNLLVAYCSNVKIENSRLDTSPHGSGISLVSCNDISIDKCEIARNAYHGILINESNNLKITGCLIEGNNTGGIMNEFLYGGSSGITITGNIIQYNEGYGVESYAARQLVVNNNNFVGNQKGEQQLSDKKYILIP